MPAALRLGIGTPLRILANIAIMLFATQLSNATDGIAAATAALNKCGLSATSSARMTSIDHLGLVSLDDGRKMRLSGIWLASQNLTARLPSFVGRNVIPFPAASRPDYTGATAAHFILMPAQSTPREENAWLQANFLSSGQAFLYVYPDRESCAAELRRFESKARVEKKGIWSQVLREDIAKTVQEQNVAIIVGEAGNLAIESADGRYGIISGRVLSTGESGRWRYLNFGDNFSRDFTVRITTRVEKRLTEQGLTIKGLIDRRVEIRGVIQSRDGPMIDVFDTAQIVIME
ncbi:MAG: hypothetical protein ABJO09_04930 [Hyphomicrobiales bacterium]